MSLIRGRSLDYLATVINSLSLPPYNDDDDKKFFERENFCETCRLVNITKSAHKIYGSLETVLDCRTIEEEQYEITHNINS